MRRGARRRTLLRPLFVIPTAFVLATVGVGPCPEDIGPFFDTDLLESIVYGRVTLSTGAAAGAGVPVYVTPHVGGCSGDVLGLYSGDSTATDSDGEYGIRLSIFRLSLPSGSGEQPSFCAEVRSAAPGSTDTVRVKREITFRVGPTDSTRVDLILR